MAKLVPESLQAKIPDFVAEGHLPPGDYLPSFDEFERSFVDIDGSNTRRVIYENWTRHREDLLERGCDPESRILLNGSYTTNKLDPQDMDLAVFIEVDTRIPDQKELVQRLSEILQGPKMKDDYSCDAYPVFVLPQDHPQYVNFTLASVAYWIKWFGTARSGSEKGRVWAHAGGLK